MADWQQRDHDSPTETRATSGGRAALANAMRVTGTISWNLQPRHRPRHRGQTASAALQAPLRRRPPHRLPLHLQRLRLRGAVAPPRRQPHVSPDAVNRPARRPLVRTTLQAGGSNFTEWCQRHDRRQGRSGLTPVTATLQPGFHTVRLPSGYVTAQRRVRITSTRTTHRPEVAAART